jgi:hypothetical protein
MLMVMESRSIGAAHPAQPQAPSAWPMRPWRLRNVTGHAAIFAPGASRWLTPDWFGRHNPEKSGV